MVITAIYNGRKDCAQSLDNGTPATEDDDKSKNI